MLRLGIGISIAAVPLMLALNGCAGTAGEGEGEGEGAAAGEGEGEGHAGEGEGSTGEGEGSVGEGEGSTGEGEGEGGGGAFSCTTGAVIAGDPTDQNPQLRPAEGTGILAAPPFPYRTVIFSGTHLFSHDGLEVVTTDLSQATPTIHIVAGSEAADASSSGPDQGLIHGPCAQARFANIAGIALLSNGSLIVSDQTANAILKITNPLDPNTCNVEFLAGTQSDFAVGSIDPGNIPQDHLTQNLGHPTDGPVATADMGLPELVVTDASDNIYFIDGGNDALREISGGNVTTLATSVADGFTTQGLTVRNGKVFAFVNLFSNLAITQIDPATAAAAATQKCHTDTFTAPASGCPANSLNDGNGGCNCSAGFANDGTGTCLSSPCHDVVFGDGSVFGLSGESIDLEGIVSVTGGFVVNFDGALFFVSDSGTVDQTPIAGQPAIGLDYTADYDPHVSHPAADLEVPFSDQSATSGQLAFLGVDGSDNIYISAEDTNSYILKVNCGP